MVRSLTPPNSRNSVPVVLSMPTEGWNPGASTSLSVPVEIYLNVRTPNPLGTVETWTRNPAGGALNSDPVPGIAHVRVTASGGPANFGSANAKGLPDTLNSAAGTVGAGRGAGNDFPIAPKKALMRLISSMSAKMSPVDK